jgi:CMP-N-acetylneuraminic acid synthetase
VKVLGIVPARSGSKGFKNKNIAKIGDKTLLELAIGVGLSSQIIDQVCISTDSQIYAEIGKKAGANFYGLRPNHLSGDQAKTSDVVIDLLRKIDEKYDFIVLLQPTAPVRTPNDIDNAFEMMLSSNFKALTSVVLIDEPHPHKIKKINEYGELMPFIRNTSSELPRQTLPKAYKLNGCIYIIETKLFLDKKTFLPNKTKPYLMNNGLNIDSEEDFLFLKYLYAKKKIKLHGLDQHSPLDDIK